MSDDEHDDDDPKSYKVGYGRPPKHSQFKKGTSGHPAGRTRKSKTIAAMLERELASMVEMKENGRTIRVSRQEAMVKRVVNSALNGSPKHIDFLIKFSMTHGVGEVFSVTEEDRAAVLRALKRQVKPPKGRNDDGGDDGCDEGGAPAVPRPKSPPSSGDAAAAVGVGSNRENRPWTLPIS